MKKVAPTKDEIALLQPFAGLTLERIHVPASREDFAAATAEIKAAGIVGFDTESKPTFVTGDVSEGPHATGVSPEVRRRVEELRAAVVAGKVRVPAE